MIPFNTPDIINPVYDSAITGTKTEKPKRMEKKAWEHGLGILWT